MATTEDGNRPGTATSHDTSRNICLLAGELSGDAYGSLLAQELRRIEPALTLWGMGSWRMRQAGVELVAESSRWAAIGVVQSLRVVPQLALSVLPRLRREVLRRRPGLVIAIDFGAFNVSFCRWCKERGFRVLYYLPPGSWRREGPLPTRIAEVTDAVATQFPWSEPRLREAGANARFVGHPLLDLIGPQPPRDEFLAGLGMPADVRLVALLPGSRPTELKTNCRAMAQAAHLIHAKHPETRFAIALASQDAVPMARKAMESLLNQTDAAGRPVAAAVIGRTHAVLAHAEAGIVCSGTATLEAAILGMPMVIIYRGTALMYVEYILRRMWRLRRIGLPNIISNRDIVPELVAETATPENMARELIGLLESPDRAERMKKDLALLRAELGEPGATRRTAEMAAALINAPFHGPTQV